MSGSIGSLISIHSLRELSPAQCFTKVLPTFSGTAEKEPSCSPLIACGLAKVKRTKENSNSSQKLHGLKGRRSQNNVAFLQMLMHSCNWATGQKWTWP